MVQKYLIVMFVFVLMLTLGNCGQKQEAAKESKESKPSAKVEKKAEPKKAKKASLGKALIRLPRDYKKGDVIDVKTVITHPQHTGIGKKAKPAHYVTDVEVHYGGSLVTSMKTYASLSKDPYISFKIKATKSAPLKVIWKDSKGNSFEKSVDVKVGG